jgi:hypothetical protein
MHVVSLIALALEGQGGGSRKVCTPSWVVGCMKTVPARPFTLGEVGSEFVASPGGT